jgi:D-serine deaminase-like pyridoxal phosphate-dependent protein
MTVGAPLPPNLQTPCLVVDRDVLESNLAAMASHARDHSVALRPHAKTHKCVEIARRQMALLPELGSAVRVAPNHVCAAVNLADVLFVTAAGAVVDQWLVVARGRNA